MSNSFLWGDEMGWKNVKEHYRIGHHVQVTDNEICIGSPYIHDIIVIGLDGSVKKRYDDSRGNEDLRRYQSEFDADPEKLRQLIQGQDTFNDLVVVYTYDGGDVIEKHCEKPEYPNVTCDGKMMYENTFSTEKEKVVEWAKRNAVLGIKFVRENIEEAEKRLEFLRSNLEIEESNLKNLEKLYPNVVVTDHEETA